MDRIQTSASVASTFSASYGILLDSPMLYSIAIISGLVGLWNSIAFLDKRGELEKNISSMDLIFKGAFVGTFSAPGLTLFLIVFLDPLLKKYLGFSIQGTDGAVLYLLYSISSVLFARAIVLKLLDFIKKGKNDKFI